MKSFQICRRALAGFVLLTALTACEGGYRGVTSGSSIAPEGYTANNQEICVQGCDNAHARCLDTSSARRTTYNDDATSVYGARTDCDYELRACLPKCRGR